MKKIIIVLFLFLFLFLGYKIYSKYNLYKFIQSEEVTDELYIIRSAVEMYSGMFYNYPDSITDPVLLDIIQTEFFSDLKIFSYNINFQIDRKDSLFCFYLESSKKNKDIDLEYFVDQQNINFTDYFIGYSMQDDNYHNYYNDIKFFEFLFQKKNFPLLITRIYSPCRKNQFFTSAFQKGKRISSDSIYLSILSSLYPVIKSVYGDLANKWLIDNGGDAQFICYNAKMRNHSFELEIICNPFNEKKDISIFNNLIKENLYDWISNNDIDSVYFPMKVFPSFFDL